MAEADLATWLREQIDGDEQLARDADPGPWHAHTPGVVSFVAKTWPVETTDTPRAIEDCQHIARWNPARVLAECAAKRALLDLHPVPCLSCCAGVPDEDEYGPLPCPTLAHLAQPFAGRLGWREEWALDG